LQADKLREMLGASRLIEKTVEVAKKLLPEHPGIEIVTPVSGVLRFTASDLEKLGRFLWDLRTAIVEDLHLPSTFTVAETKGPFKPSVDLLEDRVRRNKDAHTGAVSHPASPLFAQCLIQPQLSANAWYPDKWRGDDRRRSLLSQESSEREKESDDTFSKQFLEFEQLKEFRKVHKISLWNALPKEFSHLATASGDNYLAFIKADGDGMGRLLMKLDWDRLIPGCPGGKACLQFSQAIEDCLDRSTTTAVDLVTRTWKFSRNNRFPVAPLVRAGEDYWIVCRRDLAFQLALALGNSYAELASKTDPINRVPELAKNPLTLSFGILFVKQGFPFEAQLHMAEALVKNAKRFRASHFGPENAAQATGCLDFYWLESSAREDVIDYRESTLTITDEGQHFRLYTTPWTLPEAAQFEAAATQLADSKLASRKLKQLETIVRLGDGFANLAFEHWRRMLQPGEWDSFVAAVELLPARFSASAAIRGYKPFTPVPESTSRFWTPLLDLAKLVEIRCMGQL
jgi:hypothetical protein